MTLNARQLALQEQMAAKAGLSVPEWRKRVAEELMIKGAIARGAGPTEVAMIRACDTSTVREIVRDHYAVQGPSISAVPTSQQLTTFRGGPSVPRGTGWRDATPIGPPPGVAQCDRLMDAQDAKDRAERIAQDARLRAAQAK